MQLKIIIILIIKKKGLDHPLPFFHFEKKSGTKIGVDTSLKFTMDICKNKNGTKCMNYTEIEKYLKNKEIRFYIKFYHYEFNLNEETYFEKKCDSRFIRFDAGVHRTETMRFKQVKVTKSIPSRLFFFGFLEKENTTKNYSLDKIEEEVPRKESSPLLDVYFELSED